MLCLDGVARTKGSGQEEGALGCDARVLGSPEFVENPLVEEDGQRRQGPQGACVSVAVRIP